MEQKCDCAKRRRPWRIANRQQIPQVYWGKTLASRVKKQALEMAQQIEQVEKQLAELLAVGRFAPHHRA